MVDQRAIQAIFVRQEARHDLTYVVGQRDSRPFLHSIHLPRLGSFIGVMERVRVRTHAARPPTPILGHSDS